MEHAVKVVECPRDAWQALQAVIPAEAKAGYLRALIEAGFKHIDAVSFVSPARVPQMADAERVLELLDPPSDVEIIGIVVNLRGAERALSTGAVRTLGFPFSVSGEFLRRNQHQTPTELLAALEEISSRASAAGVGIVANLSMGFGNPYGEPQSIEDVIDACQSLAAAGVSQISLADTVGLATSSIITETLMMVRDALPGVEFGVHLYARPEEAAQKIQAAYYAGCRRFDSNLAGFGAQDAPVANLATETLIGELIRLGANPPALGPLDDLVHSSARLAAEFGGKTAAI